MTLGGGDEARAWYSAYEGPHARRNSPPPPTFLSWVWSYPGGALAVRGFRKRRCVLNHTTVLERRNQARRSQTPTHLIEYSERREAEERRQYVPNHHITVGRVAGGGGWMGGVCSCGEHTLSRVDGLIEEWARWHRQHALTLKGVFVYSS
jgi:hypothetical protein